MYNLCIGICICRGQCRSQQIFDKLQTADLRRYVFFTQKILQRDQIYRFAVIIKLYDRIKNNAVLMLIEIVSAYDLGGFDDGFLIHEHSTDYRLLCLNTVGQYPLDQCFFHFYAPC